MPAVYEIEDSYAMGGRQVLRTIDFSSGDFDAAGAGQELHTFTGDFVFERQEHACLEPECAIGEYDPDIDGVHVTACTQSPFEIRRMLAPILDLPEERIRVTAAPLGGGFGSKCDSTVESAAAVAGWGHPQAGADHPQTQRIPPPVHQAPPVREPL